MTASVNSCKFIQFVSMARKTDKSFGQFIEYLSEEHGEIFDFCCQNYDLILAWWNDAIKGCEKGC